MAAYDLTNKAFDKLTVDYLEKTDASGHNWWHCTCECGATVIARAGHLMNGTVTMCKDCKKKRHSSSNNFVVLGDTDNSINPDDFITTSLSDIDTYDNIVDFTNDGIDLLSVPVIFKIVHTINADLTYAEQRWNGKDTLAKNIDKFFKIREALNDLSSIDWNVGEVINTSIVYHLLTKNNRYDEVSYGNLQICLENLKRIASDNGDFYLAFPKICCGQDKLDWDIVKPLIEGVFGNTEFQIMLV